jgi:mRNA interferase RelE/StbE
LSYQVRWIERALKDAERLDRGTRQRIVAAVERFAETERGDIRHLQGDKSGVLRLRVGPWRVLFSQEGNEIVVRRILPRSGAYRP